MIVLPPRLYSDLSCIVISFINIYIFLCNIISLDLHISVSKCKINKTEIYSFVLDVYKNNIVNNIGKITRTNQTLLQRIHIKTWNLFLERVKYLYLHKSINSCKLNK